MTSLGRFISALPSAALRARGVRVAVALSIASTACGRLADGNLSIDVHVTSITPPAVPSSGAAQLTILGDNFDEGVTVTFDGVPAVAVSRASEQLMTVVPPPRQVGGSTIEIANLDGRSVTIPNAVHYYASTIGFSSGTVLFDGPAVGAPVFGGDIDGDGVGDAVVVDSTGSIETILLDAAGAATRVGIAVNDPFGGAQGGALVALVDLDRDGHADVVATTGVARWASSADNTYNQLQPFPAPWANGADGALDAVVGDFAGDGALTIALVMPGGMALVDPTNTPLAPGATLGDVDHQVRVNSLSQVEPAIAGDFNADGKADLAFVGPDGLVRVALGPDLATVVVLGALGDVTYGGLAAVDYNWDGVTDLVAADSTQTLVYYGATAGITTTAAVLPPLCGGTPAVHETLAKLSTPATDVALGATIAARCDATTRAYIAGVTAFDPTFALTTQPEDLTTLVDLDRDGNVDVIDTTPTVSLERFAEGTGVLGYGSIRLPEPMSSTAASAGLHIAAGSFEQGAIAIANDNVVSIVADPSQHNAVVISAALGADSDAIEDIVACDLDHDGRDDLIATVETYDAATGAFGHDLRPIAIHDLQLTLGPVLLSSADGFHRAVVGTAGGDCEVMWFADLDNDGYVDGPVDDFVFSTAGVVHTQLALDSGQRIAYGPFQAFDIDGDGDLDLYAPYAPYPDASGFGAVLLRRTGATIAAEQPAGAPAVLFSMFHADERFALQRRPDGTLEEWVVLADGAQSSVALFTVDGDGVATAAGTVALPAIGLRGPRIALGDIDGDGVSDAVIVPQQYDDGSSIAFVTRPGGLGNQLAATLGLANPTGESIGTWLDAKLVDVTGDGLADFVFSAGSYGARLGVVTNESH